MKSNLNNYQYLNHLRLTHPLLAEQWHPTLNTLQPEQVTATSQKNIWWFCPRCQTAWQATPFERTQSKSPFHCH